MFLIIFQFTDCAVVCIVYPILNKFLIIGIGDSIAKQCMVKHGHEFQVVAICGQNHLVCPAVVDGKDTAVARIRIVIAEIARMKDWLVAQCDTV